MISEGLDHSDDLKDCVARLPETDRMTVYRALSDNSTTDIVRVMKEFGVCDNCVVYYQLASLFIFYRESGIDKEYLMRKVAHVITTVYDGERVDDGETDTDAATDEKRGAAH